MCQVFQEEEPLNTPLLDLILESALDLEASLAIKAHLTSQENSITRMSSPILLASICKESSEQKPRPTAYYTAWITIL